MKVDYVNIINIELLEKAFNEGMMNPNSVGKDFGRNLPLLLSHMKFTLVISDISIYEAYMMKRFSNGNFTDFQTEIDDNNINKSMFPATYRAVQSLFILNSTIMNDKDITIKPGVFLFPVESVRKRVMVTFQGYEILSVIGDINRGADSFLIKYNNKKKENPNISENEVLVNLLISEFISEFYKYMAVKSKYVDLLTDSMLKVEYLDLIKNTNGLSMMTHVNTICGKISLVNMTADSYSAQIKEITNNINTFSDIETVYKNTDMFIVCNTSMYSFLEAFIYLPVGTILESTDIKIVYSSNEFIIPQEMSSYEARIKTIVLKMKQERDKFGNDVTNIQKYNLVQLNTKIQYTVKLNLSTANSLLTEWENAIKKNIYGSPNDYIAKELLKLIDDFKTYTMLTRKSLSVCK